jgi:guanylate kinase
MSNNLQTHGDGCDQSVLLVVSAPSGTGKTTLARRLVEETPNSVFSVSWTTRAPRGAEKNGVDYQFVTNEHFRELLHRDELAEWAQVYNHFYGTPRATVEDAKAHGRLAIFDIDVQGGEQLHAKYPETVRVFVVPPSYDELARRLRARQTESEDQIQKRLLAAESEVLRGRVYDYLLVNDDIDRTLADLKAIVRAERLRSRRFDTSRLGF